MLDYKYTNKLLKVLAICNLWLFIPSIWTTHWIFEMATAGAGDHTQVITTLLINAAQGYVVMIITTWVFLFKRERQKILILLKFL